MHWIKPLDFVSLYIFLYVELFFSWGAGGGEGFRSVLFRRYSQSVVLSLKLREVLDKLSLIPTWGRGGDAATMSCDGLKSRWQTGSSAENHLRNWWFCRSSSKTWHSFTVTKPRVGVWVLELPQHCLPTTPSGCRGWQHGSFSQWEEVSLQHWGWGLIWNKLNNWTMFHLNQQYKSSGNIEPC